MVNKNDEILLKITDTTTEGSGISDVEGYKIFVIDAVKGDTVLAHIIKVKKNYAVAIIKEIINKSDLRTSPACNVSSRCGGCCFDSIDYQYELLIKSNQIVNNFKKIAGLTIKLDETIPSPNIIRYRNKAQYPVKIKDFTEIGFYASKTHRIIDCDDCKLQPEEFKEIIEVFKEWVTENKLFRFIGTDKEFNIKHLYLRKAFGTGQIMVCLVVNKSGIPKTDLLISKLLKINNNISSILLNINGSDSNVVLGKECELLYGNDYITDKLCGLSFRISPLSFYQVNHDCAELLYEKVKEFADTKGTDTVLDLYCGTGTIGLTLCHNIKKLIGIEIIEQAIENAKENARINGINNAEFYCSDADNFTEYLKSSKQLPDTVIIDPPRKGCDERVINSISVINPQKIIYVSCDNATMARDCRTFNNFGYNISKISAVDMFPRTGNVEVIALLIK